MLELTAIILIFAAAGFDQRGDDVEIWTTACAGAVAILAYAGIADALPAIMVAKP